MATPAAIGNPEQAAGHAGAARALVLAALGVVYGDIGTSPLYTMREAFGHGGLHLSEPAVLGVLSLVFWSLLLVVTVKYVALILRADNRGEGGVLALGTLAARAVPRTPALCRLIPALTIAGLALFYGDGLITPAISVLSAVEGLETAAPALGPYVVPVAALILIGLFLIQSRGTASVGMIFGPVMLVWFTTLGLLGLAQVVQNPAVLAALDPRYAVGLFGHAGWQAFVALGAIVLAVTGAEALYADMGHFGKAPIRLAWFGLVLPGPCPQLLRPGRLVLRDPTALEHPFYHLVPGWALWPLIGLATLATVIASQAVISGVFSLTRQAIQLGYLPRMTVRYTSAAEIGQVYIPRVNWPPARGRSGTRARVPPRASPPPTASRSPGPWRSTRCWPAWWPPGVGAGTSRRARLRRLPADRSWPTSAPTRLIPPAAGSCSSSPPPLPTSWSLWGAAVPRSGRSSTPARSRPATSSTGLTQT